MQELEEIDRHLGRRVAEQRRRCGVSTPELAMMMGIDPLDLALREEGQRRFSGAELKSVSTALDVSLSSL